MYRRIREKLKRLIKRSADILISGSGIAISFPVWLLSSIAIIIESGGPVFIRQERIGKKGIIFYILKFRSMDKTAHTENPGEHDFVTRDNRITKVGRILRATAMDELPQLLAIFKGHMSFVGPRAVHPQAGLIGSKYTKMEDIPDFHKRASVVPGLTGLAQIYARKDDPMEKKIKYDILYIKKYNPFLDIRLFILSFLVTFMGKWETDGTKIRRKYRTSY